MTTILAIAANKGGTGKTTTAVTIGHRLATLGHTVLIVDCDPQGNLADFLGLTRAPGLYRLLVERAALADVVADTGRENLSIIPGDHTTARAAQQLVGEPGLDHRLARALSTAGYDWIILDTAPSLGLIQILAFVAADLLLIPTELNFASGLGVGQVLATVARLRQDVTIKLDPKTAHILPTKWDLRLRESTPQLKALDGHFPNQVWQPIPTDAKVAEAPAFGATILEYAPKCAAAVGRDVHACTRDAAVAGGDGNTIGGYVRATNILLEVAK